RDLAVHGDGVRAVRVPFVDLKTGICTCRLWNTTSEIVRDHSGIQRIDSRAHCHLVRRRAKFKGSSLGEISIGNRNAQNTLAVVRSLTVAFVHSALVPVLNDTCLVATITVQAVAVIAGFTKHQTIAALGRTRSCTVATIWL